MNKFWLCGYEGQGAPLDVIWLVPWQTMHTKGYTVSKMYELT